MSTEAGIWEEFRKNFKGTILQKSDGEAYESARKAWNAEASAQPRIIVMPENKEEVATAIRFARDLKIPLTARCGAHSLRCVIEDGLVIDLRKMRKVTIDTVAKTATVEGGCLLADLDEAAWKHHLAVPAGQVSHTGVSGLVLGGGFGYLSRKWGLSCDNTLRASLVNAKGEFMDVTRESYPDLYWAVRGAGHHFGIVYEFVFQLYDMPEFSTATLIFPYSHETATETLKILRTLIKIAPEELAIYVTITHHPQFGPVQVFNMTYIGNVEALNKAAAPLLTYGAPVVKDVKATEYPVHQKMMDPMVPHGIAVYNFDGFRDEIDDSTIAVMLDHFDKAPPPAMLQIITFGGAAVRESTLTGPNAFAHRNKSWVVAVAAIYPPGDAAKRDLAVGWGRAAKFITSDYVNTTNGLSTLERAFGNNVARLVEIKKKYDPDNVFSHNLNLLSSQ